MSFPPFNDDAADDGNDAPEEEMPGMRIIEGEEDATAIEDEAPAKDDVPMAFGDEEEEP